MRTTSRLLGALVSVASSLVVGTALAQVGGTTTQPAAPAAPSPASPGADTPADVAPSSTPAAASAPAPAPAPSPQALAEEKLEQDAVAFQRAEISRLSRKQAIAQEKADAAARALREKPKAEREQLKAAMRKAGAEARAAERELRAAYTTLAVLLGDPVSLDEAEVAMSVQSEKLRQAYVRQDEAKRKVDASPTEARKAPARTEEAAAASEIQNRLRAQEELNRATPTASSRVPSNKSSHQFENGDRLHYGPTVTLLRFSVARDPDEAGRYRDYEPRWEFVPPEFGFQFVYQPHNEPWRYSTFQLMSVGGMLLARIDTDDVSRGSLSLAATIGFFEETVGFALGTDLYRGLPIEGADGQSGSATAYTGLLAWSLSPQGEVTPENVFFAVTLGLQPFINAITGEVK